jgi:hypothetical protein
MNRTLLINFFILDRKFETKKEMKENKITSRDEHWQYFNENTFKWFYYN